LGAALINLRPYQQDLEDRVQAAMRRHKWNLLQLATGGGKTFTAGSMINKARLKGNRVFFTVPRRELLKQTAESFSSVGIPFSYIAAGHTHNPRELVQLATVGSLARRLDKVTPPRLIFLDETHHGSNQLGSIIEWSKGAGAWGIGLSGTPSRTDGRGLGMWYDHMECGPSVSDLMDMGSLNRYRAFAPDTPDMTGIRTVAGDYAKGQLSDKMEQDRVLVGNSVKHYKDKAMGMLNVCFCVSVKHAQIVAQSFCDNGVPAACIHGGMNDDERKRLIVAFARREIKVLTSCQLLSFGFDLSSAAQMDVTVECMSDLQPTQSLALQLQKFGRVLRPSDNPSVILDHAGNLERHGFPDQPREWTLADREKKGGGNSEPTLPVKQCGNCYYCHAPAPVCPNCGHEHPVMDRDIEEVDGELSEVQMQLEKKQERQKQGQAQTLEDLIELGKSRGYSNPRGWARNVLKGRKR
jgi:DNA repair protein RadD